MYEIYWEVMCHYCILQEVFGIRNQDISQKLWANYLFQDVNHLEVAVMKLDPLSRTSIEARIAHLGSTPYTIDSNEDGFKAGTSFQSFHH